MLNKKSLTEIERVSSGQQGIIDSNINYESKELMTDIDGKPIFKYKLNDSKNTMFAIEEDEKIVSYLAGTIIDKHFNIKRSFTNPKFRGKGYVTALYKSLFVNLGYILVSDSKLTPESISVWKKLGKLFPHNIKVYDASTGEMLSFSDDETYDYYTDIKYKFILEASFESKLYISESESRKTFPAYIMYIGENAEKFWKNRNIELL